MNQNLALGIDVGGTKIAYVIANAQGEPVAEYRIPANFAQGQATACRATLIHEAVLCVMR